MSEKKRWCPSLTAYRELQKELAEVNENYRLQMVENKNLSEEVKQLKMKLLDAAEENPLYVELKRQFEDQIEGTSRLVGDCDAWRDKYHQLEDKHKEDCQKNHSECDTLDKSNKMMEDELARQRDANKRLSEKNTLLYRENQFLKSRGLWGRVLNKKYVADEG